VLGVIRRVGGLLIFLGTCFQGGKVWVGGGPRLCFSGVYGISGGKRGGVENCGHVRVPSLLGRLFGGFVLDGDRGGGPPRVGHAGGEAGPPL